MFSLDAGVKLSGRMEGSDVLVVGLHEPTVDVANARMFESRDKPVRSFG